ncbi:MAG TPA: tetratricopeptide repeat protein [Caulobacteraceae bacterium]|jgi:tetratricopeptide (TPR) repeat protein|nr:tetratricopeptide repeat protein [Caulobacteraceae bacterium]
MSAPSAQALFEEALAQHQAGRTETARALYEQALQADPEHFDALHLLGVITVQAGKAPAGVALIERAVRLNPTMAAAWSNLGWALAEARRPDDAVAAYDRALALDPAYAAGHFNRANTLRDRGDLAGALAGYDRALGLQPGFAQAWVNRGAVLDRLRRADEAAASFTKAVALQPEMAEAHANLAKALNDLKRSDEALASAERAIALTPASAAAHNHRALALYDLRRLEEALAVADQAIALDPDYPEAHNSRAITLFDLRRLDEAIASCERALAIRPDFAPAHLNRATSLLSLGDLARGFDEYRWRWRVNGFQPAIARLRPAWEGQDLTGKSILVWGEQGFGDHLQFCRYVPLVATMAQRTAFATEPALLTLFQRSFPGVDVTTGVPDEAAFDLQVALMDLPHAFETTLETIPASIPYLAADPADVARWAARLAGERGRKVGLVWAGDTHAGRAAGAAVDRRRSLRLAQFAPLARVEGVIFVSLQKGEPAAQAAEPPQGLALIDQTGDLRDFSDTAALIETLDLVIAVDTAVAHLAGALGKPVWILSRYEGDWRWLNGREDSPWYPTARLFHQRAGGAWDDVVERVTAALSAWAVV